jgi:hypothetical protein
VDNKMLLMGRVHVAGPLFLLLQPCLLPLLRARGRTLPGILKLKPDAERVEGVQKLPVEGEIRLGALHRKQRRWPG